MTSKEIVLQTIEFRNKDQRVPRDLWMLPWTADHFPEQIKKLRQDFTWDISSPTAICTPSPLVKGDPYQVGEYVDDWGCMFTNIHKGVIGEVKRPLVADDEWKDAGNIHRRRDIVIPGPFADLKAGVQKLVIWRE